MGPAFAAHSEARSGKQTGGEGTSAGMQSWYRLTDIRPSRLDLASQRCRWVQMSWSTNSYKGNSHTSAVSSVLGF